MPGPQVRALGVGQSRSDPPDTLVGRLPPCASLQSSVVGQRQCCHLERACEGVLSSRDEMLRESPVRRKKAHCRHSHRADTEMLSEEEGARTRL